MLKLKLSVRSITHCGVTKEFTQMLKKYNEQNTLAQVILNSFQKQDK